MNEWRINAKLGTSRFVTWIGLGGVLLVYLALALMTTQVLHFSLALDEGYHLELITFIKQQGRLPITYEERAQMARADLPPLYHLLVAAVSSEVTVGDYPHFKYFGDSFRYRAIDHQSDQPYILPTEDFTPPYLGRFQVWQIGRWFSVGLSAVTLVVVFFTLQAIPLGSRPLTSLFGTALLAFTPRYLIVGSALNDDSLLGLSAALYFLMLVQVIKTPTRWFPLMGLGVMLGVTATIKYSLALMPLEIIGVLGFIAVREKWGWPWFLSRLAVVGFLTILCSGWWFGWNIWFFNTIAKDGLIGGTVRALFMGGYNATLNSIGGVLGGQAVGTQPSSGPQAGTWPDWFSSTFLSFWGFNTNENFFLFSLAYIIIGLILATAGVGLVRLWRRPGAAYQWLLLAGFHVSLLFIIPLLRFATSGRIGQTAQGRHILFPAAAAIMGLIAWGVATTVPPRWRGMVFAVIIAGMLGWTGLHLYQLTQSSAPSLPLRTLPQAAEWLAQPVGAKFGEGIELVSYEIDPQPEQGRLNLNLAWHSLAQVNENYLLLVQLINSEGQVASHWLGYTGQGRVPTLAWMPGDSIFDRLALPLLNLPAGDYTVQVQVMNNVGSLPVQQGSKGAGEQGGSSNSSLPLATIKFNQPTNLSLFQHLSLTAPAGPVEIAFALWQADGPVAQPATSNVQPSTLSTYRYPATISIVTSTSLPDGSMLDLQLVDAAGQTWPATQNQANIYTFVIGPRWPSGDYRLQATLRRGDQVVGQAASEPLLTVENWWQRRFEAPEIGVPTEANFADQFKFLGYTLPHKQVKAGESFPLTLYWQALPHRSPQADFIQFNHLLDSAGALRGGYDRQPLEYYSTLLWSPGEVVVDGYAVPVNADAPPGQYYLSVGYYLTVGEAAVNLPLVENGQMTDVTSITIGPIEVVAP